MANDTPEIAKPFQGIARDAARQREKLLRKRTRLSADVPLRFWRQQAHFTTPASGTPEKAITGLSSVPKLMERFGIDRAAIAGHCGAPRKHLDAVLDSGSPHSPFVMVDVEDAVALTPDSIRKARDGAIRCFRDAHWGATLAFYRPGGLLLESAIDDLLTVLPAVAQDRAPEDFPIEGIVWPKAEHEDEIEWLCDLLSETEKKLGLPRNRIKVEFLVESGHAVDRLSRLAKACSRRLVGIIWGIADYSADTNLPAITNDHPLCDWARYEIVNVAGAYNVPAIDAMTLNYPTPVHRGADLSVEQTVENRAKILDALRDVYHDALHGIALGMSGKWVGHPLQLLMVLTAYQSAIAPAQIEKDLREIEAYTSSVAAGAGATVMGEGAGSYMADRATDRHLRARLRRAAAWGLIPTEKALSLGIVSGAEAGAGPAA